MIIPHNIIEEVKTRTDIVDVVSDYVRLKKRGSNFVGLCPFHTEKTPSFNINPARDIYKCFGCGVGGDVFNFVSEVEGLSFPETVRLLADRAGIAIPDEQVPDEEASETESIYHALRFAARMFFKSLTQSEHGQTARTYLDQRGITADSVKRFGLGYAGDGWDVLLNEATKSHISADHLEKAGLVIARKSGDGHYDRYRNRIIFPITSHVGKIVGFGGRVLDPEDEPKYINSPETKVYSKSRVLYGLFQARNAIRKRDEVLLVEGYTDVIALHQAGVDHAVATCGTALTAEQIHLLSRYTSRVVLLYDADSAGIRAAFRAIDLILESGVGASAVSLPRGSDPDSFIRDNDSGAFETYLKNERQDVVHFILTHARSAGTMETPEGQAGVQRTILKTIAKIPDPLVRESYIKLASDAMDIPDLQLREVIRDMARASDRRRNTSPGSSLRDRPGPVGGGTHNPDGRNSGADFVPPGDERPGTQSQSEPTIILPSEKTLFSIMLRDGLPLIEFVMSSLALSDFSEGTSRTLAGHLISMYEHGSMDLTGLTGGKFGDAIRDFAAEVLTHNVEPSENWSKLKNIDVPGLNAEARESAVSAMTLLKLDRIDAIIRGHKERMFMVQQDEAATRSLAQEMIELSRKRKLIQERKFVRHVHDSPPK